MSAITSFLEGSTFFGVFFCLAAYFIGVLIQKKLKLGIFNPLLVADVIVIAFLCLTGVDYARFQESAQPLSFLLTPATVCLAVPLYRQLEQLKRHWQAVIVGIVTGVMSSGLCIFLLSALFGLSHVEYVSFLPKSITTAIGMSLTEELGGHVSITVGAIIITGLLGNMVGVSVLRLLHITEPVAKGIAMGSSSHAFGTARALTMGEVEGAMSSLSIVISGLCTVVAAQMYAGLL